MPPARHAHISGRFDCNPRAFARYVKDVVTRGRCTSFTTTETYGSLKPMRWHLDGWIITRRGEYVIGVRRDTYRRTQWTSFSRLSEIYTGRQEWRDLFAYRRTFTHIATGRRVLFISAHAPSHVELGDNWRGGSQTEASKNGLTKMGRNIRKNLARRPGLVVVAGLDTNMDHKREVWRARATSMIGLPSMWDARRPGVGTHGKRVIDVIYSNAPMHSATVSSAPRTSPKLDHLAAVVAIDIAA